MQAWTSLLSKNLQDERLTAHSSNKGVPSISPRIPINCQQMESTNQPQRLFTSSRNPRPFTGIFGNQQYKIEDCVWSRSERRRSSSVGEMCSETLKHFNSLACYNRPLLQRRRSLDVGKATEKASYEHAGFKCNNENAVEALGSVGVGENTLSRDDDIQLLKLPVKDKEDGVSDKVNLENSKLNVEKRERKLSVFYSRPPSTVVEEDIEEVAQETENFTIQDTNNSRSNSPSPPRVTETTKRNDDRRLLPTRKSFGKLFSKHSPLGLEHQGNKAEEKIMTRFPTIRNSYSHGEKGVQRKLFTKDIYYKETTSSLLRKQNSKDSGIELIAKDRNKMLPSFVPKEQTDRRNSKSGSINTSFKSTDRSLDYPKRISPDIVNLNKEAISRTALLSPKFSRKDYFG